MQEQKDGRFRARSLFVPVIAVALALIAIIAFGRSTNEMLTDNAYRVLREESSILATSFKAKLNGLYSVLRAFSSSVGDGDSVDMDNIKQRMTSIVGASEFTSLGYVDVEGNATLYSGSATSVADREYFREALAGKQGIEFILVGRIDGNSRVIISVPVYRDGKIAGVVFGSILADNFVQFLISESYDGASYSFITDGEGHVIIRAENENMLTSTTDILDFFGRVELEGGVTVESIKSDISGDSTRAFSYLYNGQRRYVSFSPLGIEDWCVFNAVPGEVVEAETAAMNFRVSLLTLELVLCVGLIFAFAIYDDRKKMRQLERDKELLRQSEESYDTVMRLSDGVLFVGDYKKDTIAFNPYYKELFGRDPICVSISDFAKPNPAVYPDDIPIYENMGRVATEGAENASFEFRVSDASGAYLWQRTDFTTVFDENGEPLRLLGKITNIDAQKKQLMSLRNRAENDSLSRLLNHSSFEARVNELLAVGEKGAFFILDVDNFKRLNDTYGHPAGDSVITAVAERMRTYFRSGDAVGRMGGDEFAAFVTGSVDEKTMRAKAEGLCKAIKKLKFEDNPDMTVTCSVGAARTTETAATFRELYDRADRALYKAKESGRDACRLSR